MNAQPEFLPEEITQRDLRNRSTEIMDAVAHGHGFTVTRNGHRIGELIPMRRGRRFVPRAEFVAMSRRAPAIALAEDLPLYTTNPDDFAGLAKLITLVQVTRPAAAG